MPNSDLSFHQKLPYLKLECFQDKLSIQIPETFHLIIIIIYTGFDKMLDFGNEATYLTWISLKLSIERFLIDLDNQEISPRDIINGTKWISRQIHFPSIIAKNTKMTKLLFSLPFIDLFHENTEISKCHWKRSRIIFIQHGTIFEENWFREMDSVLWGMLIRFQSDEMLALLKAE